MTYYAILCMLCIISKYCCQQEFVYECVCLELSHVHGQRHTNDMDSSGVFYQLNCSH